MSYIAASAAFLTLGMNFMGAQSAKARGKLEGKEYDAQALHTLITHCCVVVVGVVVCCFTILYILLLPYL